MEVHDAFKHDTDHFIRECACLFHKKRLKGYLFLSFCIQFCRWHVSIALQHALTFAIERKIALARNTCSRPPINIRPLDFIVCMWMTLKGWWMRYRPTMRGTSSLPSLAPAGSASFGLPFCFACDGFGHWFYWFFCPFTNIIL